VFAKNDAVKTPSQSFTCSTSMPASASRARYAAASGPAVAIRIGAAPRTASVYAMFAPHPPSTRRMSCTRNETDSRCMRSGTMTSRKRPGNVIR
jgi:hypothetical protein